MNSKSTFIALTLFLSLYACERKKAQVPQRSPEMIWGEDEDRSGVRDDVESWLSGSPYKGRERQALHYLAATYQALTISANHPSESRTRMQEMVRALDCLNLTMGPGERARDARETLKKVQFNSPERIAAFRSAQSHFGSEKIKPLESYREAGSVCPF